MAKRLRWAHLTKKTSNNSSTTKKKNFFFFDDVSASQMMSYTFPTSLPPVLPKNFFLRGDHTKKKRGDYTLSIHQFIKKIRKNCNVGSFQAFRSLVSYSDGLKKQTYQTDYSMRQNRRIFSIFFSTPGLGLLLLSSPSFFFPLRWCAETGAVTHSFTAWTAHHL